MSFLPVSACTTASPVRKGDLLPHPAKMALITDIAAAILVAIIAVFAMLAAQGYIDMGSLNVISFRAGFILLCGSGLLVIVDLVALVVRLASEYRKAQARDLQRHTAQITATALQTELKELHETSENLKQECKRKADTIASLSLQVASRNAEIKELKKQPIVPLPTPPSTPVSSQSAASSIQAYSRLAGSFTSHVGRFGGGRIRAVSTPPKQAGLWSIQEVPTPKSSPSKSFSSFAEGQLQYKNFNMKRLDFPTLKPADKQVVEEVTGVSCDQLHDLSSKIRIQSDPMSGLAPLTEESEPIVQMKGFLEKIEARDGELFKRLFRPKQPQTPAKK